MSSVHLRLPFTGRWVVQNSPARRVPSHGTDLLGLRYAIDFVGVDDAHRTAPVRDRRTALATEPPERFFAFGRPILAATLVHLRAGSVRVGVGDEVSTGQQVGECGNSGKSTQPHAHVRATDSADLAVARAVPIAFPDFREWPWGRAPCRDRESGVPDEASVVEPLG